MITPKSKKVVLAGLLSATLAGGTIASAAATVLPAIAETQGVSFTQASYATDVYLKESDTQFEAHAVLPLNLNGVDPSTLTATAVYDQGGPAGASTVNSDGVNFYHQDVPAEASSATVTVYSGGTVVATATLNFTKHYALPAQPAKPAFAGDAMIEGTKDITYTPYTLTIENPAEGLTGAAVVYFKNGTTDTFPATINGDQFSANVPTTADVNYIELKLNDASGKNLSSVFVEFPDTDWDVNYAATPLPGDGNTDNGGSTEQPGDGNTDNGGSTEQPGDGNTDNGGETVVPGEEEKPAEGSELEPGTAAGEKDEAAKEEAKSEAKDGATILPNTSDPAVAGGVVAGLAAVVSGAAALIRRKK